MDTLHTLHGGFMADRSVTASEETLRARARLEALGEGVSDAALVIDDQDRVIWANEAARHAFVGGGGQLVGQRCHQVVHGRRKRCDLAAEICPVATVRISGQTERCDKTITNATGERVPCTLTARPVLDPDGRLLEVVLTRRERSGDGVWRVLQQQTDDLSLLHSLTELGNRGGSQAEVLRLLGRGVRRGYGCLTTSVYLLDEGRTRLTLQPPGLPKATQRAIERILRGPIPPLVIPLERAPLLMRALLDPRATVIDDPGTLRALAMEHGDGGETSKLVDPVLKIIGVETVLMLPLVQDGQPIGLLTTARGQAFQDGEIRRLEHLAEQAASIIAQHQLRADHERISHRQSLLLQSVAEAVMGLNGDGEVVFANPAAASLLGRSESQLLGQDFRRFCGPPAAGRGEADPSRALLASLADRRPRYDLERELCSADGARLPVRLSTVPLDEPELALVITFRDIGDQIRHREAERRSTERLRRSFAGTVAALRRLAEMRDPYTAGHEGRVAQLARAIAQRMDLDEELVDGIRLAATIHDIGKHAVPVEILTKPGALSPYEIELIRTHPIVGWEILSEAAFPDPIATVVRQHHERLDGTGYPDGISGDAITLEARIIAVADVVEAISSHRPYRASLGLEEALFEIQRHKGSHFDPQVVSACIRCFRQDGFRFD
jgi:PAS domain S-box-containing protein/putative nucleotidyltransferase with HDIG domain